MRCCAVLPLMLSMPQNSSLIFLDRLGGVSGTSLSNITLQSVASDGASVGALELRETYAKLRRLSVQDTSVGRTGALNDTDAKATLRIRALSSVSIADSTWRNVTAAGAVAVQGSVVAMARCSFTACKHWPAPMENRYTSVGAVVFQECARPPTPDASDPDQENRGDPAAIFSGGFLMENGAPVVSVTDSNFTGGSGMSGGGMWVGSCTLHVARCRFVDNHADNQGGALKLEVSACMHLTLEQVLPALHGPSWARRRGAPHAWYATVWHGMACRYSFLAGASHHAAYAALPTWRAGVQGGSRSPNACCLPLAACCLPLAACRLGA